MVFIISNYLVIHRKIWYILDFDKIQYNLQ